MLSIVVPYRNREQHVKQFIQHMKGFLNPRFPEWQIFIIQQADDGKPFNRAKLLNVGSQYADFENLCFHDVDMLPMEAEYSPVTGPTHLATQCSQFGFKMPYSTYFGGVTMIPKKDFVKVNGFSNSYWGWGAEDDDFRKRCTENGLIIQSRICKFHSLEHERKVDSKLHSHNVNLLKEFSLPKSRLDGLSSLNFREMKAEKSGKIHHVIVDIR